MSISRISARYAKSLIDLATERNALETVVDDIRSFNEIVKNRDFYLLLKSPIINTTKKLSIFKSLFEGKVNPITYAFFDIIIRKGREMYLPEISSEFMAQYKQMKNISSVTLTTASPLQDATVNQIKARLSDAIHGTIELTTKVNPDLIGGFVIETGDRRYDASVAHQLDKIKKEFISTSN
ncbi:MAG: ATP synthase F1 subunit delta [Saprospiraceae bacterium]|nr:ATP synthase F1 subunit delta [Saprospiraceae bacterium]